MNLLSLAPKRVTTPLRRRFRSSRWAQIALLLIFWLAAEWLVQYTGLPIPSGIVGMVLLLLLLGARWVSPQLFSRGAEWLLAEMLLFFVPAAMILLNNPQMLGWLGLKILLVVICGTIMVMITTAMTVELFLRFERRRRER